MATFALYIAEPSPLLLTPGNVIFPLVVLPAAFDTTPPQISNVVPAQGASLGVLEPLRFRLTDNNGAYALDELWVGFGAGSTTYELVHDGASFKGRYATGSSRSVVTGGWDFVLARVGGWAVGRLKLRASVVDASGNVVVVSA